MNRLCIAGLTVAAVATCAMAQIEIPDYRFRARLRTLDHGQWGGNSTFGNADFRVHSRFMQVYYGGVRRSDEFRCTISFDFAGTSGLDPSYESSQYNTDYDVYFGNRFVGRLFMNTPVLGQGARAASFRAGAVAAGTVTYRWQREINGVWTDLADGIATSFGRVQGTATPLMTIREYTSASAGSYRCRMSTGCGTVFSTTATLTVCAADHDCDGAVDGDDVIAFMNQWDLGSAGADITRDGGVDGDDVIEFFARWDSGC